MDCSQGNAPVGFVSARQPLSVDTTGRLVSAFIARQLPGLLHLSPDLLWGLESHPEGGLSLWELASGQELLCLEADSAFFSQDGLHLVALNPLRVWHCGDWKPLALPFMGEEIGHLCTGPDLLATAARLVHLCRLSQGRILTQIDPHRGQPLSAWVALRPDGAELATLSEVLEEPHYWSTYRLDRHKLSDSAGLVWPSETVRSGGRPLSLVYSDWGTRLALTLRQAEVLVWDFESEGGHLVSLPVKARGFCFADSRLGLVLEDPGKPAAESRVGLSAWELDSGRMAGGYLDIPGACQLRRSLSHVLVDDGRGIWILDSGSLMKLLLEAPGRRALPSGLT